MKILNAYNSMAKEMFLEAEVDDDKIIKYKKEDGEQGEMKASSAKTMPKDHPAKIAYDKMTDSDSDSDTPKGQALGGSDFDRDGGDDKGGDDKSDMGSGSNDDIKADLRKNPEKLDDMSNEELEDVFPTHEEYQEFEDLRNQKVLKDKHPKLHKLASQDLQAEKELESLEQELKDKLQSGEFADPFVSGKKDPEGKKKFEAHQQKIQDAEEKREDASNAVYYYQQDNADALDADNIPYDVKDLVKGEEKKKDDMDKGKPNEDDDDYARMTDDTQEKVADEYGLSAMDLYDNAGKEPEDFNSWNEYEDHLHNVAKDLVDKRQGGSGMNDSIQINGKKYRPIKESKKPQSEEKDFTQLLKENYKRFSRK